MYYICTLLIIKRNIMELIKTTPEIAESILRQGNRKITIANGRKVEWINLNNMTLFAQYKLSGCTYDLEDVELFINVPTNAKTVY